MFSSHQCLLHHVYVSQVNNDDAHQGLEIVSGDKDIHLLLGVVWGILAHLQHEDMHSQNLLGSGTTM